MKSRVPTWTFGTRANRIADALRTLERKIASSNSEPVSVWISRLGFGALPGLLGTFLRHGRFRLTYNAASIDGRVLAGLLRATGILSSGAKHIEFSLHGLRVDDSESRRLLAQGWLPNRFTDLFMQTNEALFTRFKYPDPRVRRDRVIINFRKAAAHTTMDMLILLELARYHHKIENVACRRLIIITPHAILAHLIPSEWVGEDVEFKTTWSRQYSLVFRLGRGFLRFLNDSVHPKQPQTDQPASIAGSAVWGTDPSTRLNDLFWFWDSKIPGERAILFFDRLDRPATSETVARAEQSGIRCVVVEKDAVGDSPHLLWQARPGFKTAATRLWRTTRMFFWGLFRGRTRQWIARQTLDMMYSSEHMEDFLSDFNVRALFHYQDVGLDYPSLACDTVDAARIGYHWSYIPWPGNAAARIHQVYFVWGPHLADILEATGSCVDHVLWSGCMVHGAYPGSEFGDAPSVDKSAIETNGASRVIALFDASLPCAGFYEYFFKKTVEDPQLGLLIKPKHSRYPWSRYNMKELTSLYEKAVATGRVRFLDESISPTQAAAAADISVSVDINSASVCSALAGHRAVHLDYVRLHEGPLADWAALYKDGRNRLVFDDPDELWEQLNIYFDEPDSNNKLGIAEKDTLEHIDPFRDGRSNERIGRYLGWYLAALDAGLDRDPALEQADARYAAEWGHRSGVSGVSDSPSSPALQMESNQPRPALPRSLP